VQLTQDCETLSTNGTPDLKASLPKILPRRAGASQSTSKLDTIIPSIENNHLSGSSNYPPPSNPRPENNPTLDSDISMTIDSQSQSRSQPGPLPVETQALGQVALHITAQAPSYDRGSLEDNSDDEVLEIHHDGAARPPTRKPPNLVGPQKRPRTSTSSDGAAASPQHPPAKKKRSSPQADMDIEEHRLARSSRGTTTLQDVTLPEHHQESRNAWKAPSFQRKQSTAVGGSSGTRTPSDVGSFGRDRGRSSVGVPTSPQLRAPPKPTRENTAGSVRQPPPSGVSRHDTTTMPRPTIHPETKDVKAEANVINTTDSMNLIRDSLLGGHIPKFRIEPERGQRLVTWEKLLKVLRKAEEQRSVQEQPPS